MLLLLTANLRVCHKIDDRCCVKHKFHSSCVMFVDTCMIWAESTCKESHQSWWLTMNLNCLVFLWLHDTANFVDQNVSWRFQIHYWGHLLINLSKYSNSSAQRRRSEMAKLFLGSFLVEGTTNLTVWWWCGDDHQPVGFLVEAEKNVTILRLLILRFCFFKFFVTRIRFN